MVNIGGSLPEFYLKLPPEAQNAVHVFLVFVLFALFMKLVAKLTKWVPPEDMID